MKKMANRKIILGEVDGVWPDKPLSSELIKDLPRMTWLSQSQEVFVSKTIWLSLPLLLIRYGTRGRHVVNLEQSLFLLPQGMPSYPNMTDPVKVSDFHVIWGYGII